MSQQIVLLSYYNDWETTLANKFQIPNANPGPSSVEFDTDKTEMADYTINSGNKAGICVLLGNDTLQHNDTSHMLKRTSKLTYRSIV